MILGITGSIGGGKSYVAECFSRHGWDVFSADEFCRALREKPDAAFLEETKKRFGDAFFDASGGFDRAKIADAVFSNAGKMTDWLALVYPALDAEIDRVVARCRKTRRNGVFEIPLLFENDYAPRFDAVLAVYCGDALRRERLMKCRGLSPEEIARREACQLPESVKLERADYAVINRSSPDALDAQISVLIKKFTLIEQGKGSLR
ncbi:MAG: dephospho-CoA kinase [Victivallaceae bacterium]|nr:dephospho-CoA kinase [Victivallaceae bacterium]